MEIHQCMTCGERWGVGTSAYGMIAEKHRLMGHQVSIGDSEVLRLQAMAQGLDIKTVQNKEFAVYRCLSCEEIWVHGTTDAYERAIEHTGQGHLVFQGAEKDMCALTKDQIGQIHPQTPNPLDPASISGGGAVLSFGPGE